MNEINNGKLSTVANAWKIAPGEKAWVWEECSESGCITINWLNEANFLDFTSKHELTRALVKAKAGGEGGAPFIWHFVHDIKKKDVVVANDGRSSVVGLGIVTSDYLPPKHRKNPRRGSTYHKHARRIKWLVKERIDLPRNFFGTQTVLLIDPHHCDKIKRAYCDKYPELKDAMERLFPSDPNHQQDADVAYIANTPTLSATSKKTLIDARLGQGRFRGHVLRHWGTRCAVTSSKTEAAIRASHIKPWRDCNNAQRLDPQNGLPLIASLDALFDRGLISFESSGRMIVSSLLSPEEQNIFGLKNASLRKSPSTKMASYLAHHRKHTFQR